MTVSSQYKEELTADGRTDHGNGTNVKIESVFQHNKSDIDVVKNDVLAIAYIAFLNLA